MKDKRQILPDTGFTILELLLACFIFPIIVFGIANGFDAVRKSYTTARELNEIYAVLSACPEIDRALRRKVWLPSGGYLFFDKTEAMYTIDVNSGRSSQQASSNVEEALVHINLEAADEIARQLRIRNIGGLVICDFIDMRSRKNQR